MLKVHFQYPWSVPDSPYYKYLLKYAPRDVTYLNVSVGKHGVKGPKTLGVLHSVKKAVAWTRVNILPIPNLVYLKNSDCDIAHCAHCLPINQKYNYVVDIEDWWALGGCHSTLNWGKNWVKKLLIRKNCKSILAWTESTKDSFIKHFPEVANKTIVLYPAVPVKKFKRKTHKGINILFIARYFWNKGGLITLETMKQLKDVYGDRINCIVRSDVPLQLKKKYANLTYVDFVEDIDSLYRCADIFIYPGLVDTFGFSLLEAMSFGIPVITVNTGGTKNCKEIIQNGKTGLIIDFPYYKGNEIYEKCRHMGDPERKLINNLIKKTSLLIENAALRKKMSENCKNFIKNGKFSITARNKKLRKIYEDALK